MAEDAGMPLFPELNQSTPQQKIRRYKRVQHPIWTENKARFIQQYLKIFVQITKHGTYIDGFAGPQYIDRLDAWTAALVLASEPRWLRHFFLCEKNRKKLGLLKKIARDESEVRDNKGRKLYRTIKILPGDFNATVNEILRPDEIPQQEATFCLLDQHTFECDWKTLVSLAKYKDPPHKKIELLYFLGVGWLHRAMSGVKKSERLDKWWGKDDYQKLRNKPTLEVAEIVRTRFSQELGYKHVAAYPIFEKQKGNRIMYYMIHASDHDDAPALMVRAHSRAVRALPPKQELFSFPENDKQG